jgi:hypothetical protein
MDTIFQSKTTSTDLTAKITTHLEELAKATDKARISKEMLQFLDVCSRFHKYSPFNTLLILMARPDATYVAGYRKWQTLNRFVKRGERGISILAPIMIKEDQDNPNSASLLVGFKIVQVFDIVQTEGQPLPEPPNWISPEKNALLANRLIEFARGKGIRVTIKKLPGQAQGVSKGGVIELAPAAGVKTLIHEIAHELLHRGTDRPEDSTIREVEAEATAFVVSKHFGLGGLESGNYIALHSGDSKIILGRLERIRNCASKIITAVETK